MSDRPTAPATTAGIGLGCVALLMLGLQPLLLGALLEEHRLNVAQLTQAATVELLVLGMTAGLMGAFVPHRRLRAVAILGGVLLAGGNAACLAADGGAFVLWRAAAGLGGGILVWIAIGLITQGLAPARLSGIFLAAQTAAQAVLAALLPVTLMPHYGANGGLAALAVISALSLAAVPLLPSRLPELPKEAGAAGGLNVAGALGLGSSFLFMAGIVGTWVFIDALAALDGITPSVAHYAVALSLVSQVAGALVATAVSHRLPAGGTLLVAAASCMAALAVMAGRPGDFVFMAAVLVFGFFWLFTLPFQVPLLIQADPTRRSALLLAGAQLLGGGAGPQITGLFATDTALRAALAAAGALFALCAVFTLGAMLKIRQRGKEEAVLF